MAATTAEFLSTVPSLAPQKVLCLKKSFTWARFMHTYVIFHLCFSRSRFFGIEGFSCCPYQSDGRSLNHSPRFSPPKQHQFLWLIAGLSHHTANPQYIELQLSPYHPSLCNHPRTASHCATNDARRSPRGLEVNAWSCYFLGRC